MAMKLSDLNEIYDKYYLMVMKVAFNILHDYHYAQDVCQEVFLALYSKCNETEDNRIKAWLLVVTRRKAIDYYRKKYFKTEIVDAEPQLTANEGLAYDISEACIRRVFGEEFFAMLKAKDRYWYEIVQRVLIAGESQKKVADDLGISLPNLRIKLYRAKAWIREHVSYDDLF